METDVPQVAAKKKEPTKRNAAKKTLPAVSEISDSEDAADLDLDEEVVAPEAQNKGGRKAGAKPNAAKPPAAAAKRRGPAAKQSQASTQKLLTEMLKPSEKPGISPAKKVRKTRASPFNKKSGSVLDRVGKDNEATGSEDISVSAAASDNSDDVVEVPARARPQRANRRKTTYVVSDSDSESEEVFNDSDFDKVDDDDSDFDEDEA